MVGVHYTASTDNDYKRTEMKSNLQVLSIPYNLFYLWRTQRLALPELRSVYRTNKFNDTYTEYTECPTYRLNRMEMSRPSTGRSAKHDIGYHYRGGEASHRFEGHSYLPVMTGACSGNVHEWRITVAGQQSDTIMWTEQGSGERVGIPRNIVFTNYGWQTIDTFMRNPHMKLYRPLGVNVKRILESNFREINRDRIVYDSAFGYYDTENYAKVEVGQRTELHDITDTFECQGRSYPISAGAYRINDIKGLRKFVRALVERVINQQLTLELAIKAFKHALRNDGYAEIIFARGTTPITPDRMWRGLYMQKYAKLRVDKVRILKELSESVKIVGSQGFSRGSCAQCGNTINTWDECETVEIDYQQYARDNGNDEDDYNDEPMLFCSEEHALSHSMVSRPVGIPNKHGYHTDVLRFIPMGESVRKGAKGALRRCGIELETYHCASTSNELTKYIKGGSILKKAKDKGTKKSTISWDNDTYKKFGAIPTRDGSINERYGVEWVFRPSDLRGMFKDVSHFLAMTQGYIEHDADTADPDNRTYGLHIHVTATDTMMSQPTRVRVALVASRLDKIFHALGHRGYTNYTRKLDTRFLINHDSIQRRREQLKSYVVRASRPAWQAYIKPTLSGGERERLDMANANRECHRASYYERDTHGRDLLSGVYNSNLFVRYNMTNISLGRPTIEFRHGRSFVDSNHIMINVELSQAVALFGSYEIMSVAQAGYEDTPYKFRDYVFRNSSEYPLLTEWFLQNMNMNLVTPVNRRIMARIGERRESHTN